MECPKTRRLTNQPKASVCVARSSTNCPVRTRTEQEEEEGKLRDEQGHQKVVSSPMQKHHKSAHTRAEF
jgi:hypothetical protein